jgi:hypothetical protein
MAKLKKITIEDFTPVVPWDQVRDVFVYTYGKREGMKQYRAFEEWMFGQTYAYNGVYPWDLERFLRGLPVID